MRILYLCHRFPYPPKRGGKIRPFNMIQHLAAEHEVTVASIARSDEEAEEGRGLETHCADYLMGRLGSVASALRMFLRLPTRTPSSMGYFLEPSLRRRVHERLAARRYDLIFVHCSSMAPYVAGVTGIPKVLDFGDMDSQKWLAYARFKPAPLRWGYLLEGFKLQLAEMDLASRFDTCTCTTLAELKTLEGYGTALRTGWFPNGVDRERFRPASEPYDPDTICFVGRMDYYPNQECMFDFCARTLPRIRRRRPGVRLTIVGADPSPAVRKLGEIPGVTVTGSVPEVQPWVHKAALTIAPLNIARGTQNKILESLAMGVPCVCSRLAAGGVDAVPGEHLLTATTPDGYADAVLRLLEDPAERERFSRAGRTRIETHHDWASSMKRLDRILEECVSAWNAEHRLNGETRP